MALHDAFRESDETFRHGVPCPWEAPIPLPGAQSQNAPARLGLSDSTNLQAFSATSSTSLQDLYEALRPR